MGSASGRPACVLNDGGQTVGQALPQARPESEGLRPLSPSILREFLTYSVVGLAEDLTGLDAGLEISPIASVRSAHPN
jgi:hypothetical protein